MATTFRRISKWKAKRLFDDGQTIYFCPCKMRPGYPWNCAAMISPREHFEKADRYNPATNGGRQSDLWKGAYLETAWALAYNNWAYYNNLCNEVGYYAHYYIEN